MSKKKLLLSIIFLVVNIVSAQEIKLPKNVIKTFNDSRIIYFFTNNTFSEIDVSTYNLSEPKVFQNNGYNIANYKAIKIKDTFYFIQNTGGLVLKLKNNVLERIDNSFNHKMQINSSIFKYNNQIYRYGGYGYFSARDFMVKFDFGTREWESIKVNDDKYPIGRFDNFYTLNDHDLIVIGGRTVDKLDREKRNILNDIWKFSFNKMKWTHLLNHPEITFVNSNAIKFDNNILYRDSQQIKVLSLDSYELKAFDISSTYLKINNNFKTHFHNNNFHFVVNRNNGDRVLIKRTKKELFGITNTQKFLTNKNYLTHENISLIGIFIIILFILLLYRRYLKSIFLYPKRIKYRNNTIFITNDEYIILKEFIKNQNILENNILQNILNKDQYDKSYNIRIKNNTINSLNSKLKILFKDNNINFIDMQKSEYDKRYKRYLLNFKELKIVVK